SAEEIIECANKLTEIGEVPTGLILIDTVSRALFGGDENSPKDMGSLVGNLAYIQEQTGAHVAALHHIPADGTQRLRGHGALLGACDTTIKVESLNGCRAATVDKVNDGPDGERVTFDLKILMRRLSHRRHGYGFQAGKRQGLISAGYSARFPSLGNG